MEELNQEELNLSSGGYWNHVLTYMTLIALLVDELAHLHQQKLNHVYTL